MQVDRHQHEMVRAMLARVLKLLTEEQRQHPEAQHAIAYLYPTPEETETCK
jgi:hypothetical protein